MITIAPGLAIDESELEERFIRASGPGGQNVNKVATAVELRFDVAGSACLPEPLKARLLQLAGQRATSEGVLVIQAQRFRSQARNRADAVERLVGLIARAARVDPPRVKTRPPKAAKEKRLAQKARRAGLKAGRGRPDFDD